LAAGLYQDPLGELTAFPRPPIWISGGRFAAGEWRGRSGNKRGRRKRREGRKGRRDGEREPY